MHFFVLVLGLMIGLTMSLGRVKAQSPIEYKVTGVVTIVDSRPEIQKELNQQSAQGWSLVAIYSGEGGRRTYIIWQKH